MVSEQIIRDAIPHALLRTDLTGLGERYQGKVRDNYLSDDRRVLVATDRISAFDRVLGAIPFKGQVLNQLSAWWFEQTADLVGNHIEAVPDPNVTVARNADTLPVEVVVRGYITGVTDTALWTLYSAGVERPYGLDLPEGLRKNDKLPEAVITPTTKGGPGEHDERLSSAEVVEKGLVEPALWAQVCEVALEIFRRGQAVAERAGLILVDTKYEFGLIDGQLCLIDEVHTPDSSRYWIRELWEQNHPLGKSPEGLDKEYVRRWLASQGYKGEGQSPPLPPDVKVELARRYISAFERLTGTTFAPAPQPAAERIAAALAPFRR
ncbi:MAG: phosphoribosylaminoimidazolesuccinocarboxamide synthase [Alphaproteobacteria bacterium]|nr:phosphoribosylaminoimidazolesuccinocarboxamide synthase [Alphaproteobacteria bacterium]